MKWLKGIEDIDAGQFVAVTLEDSLDGEPAYLQTEPGILFEQVARCAAERARIRAARVGKLKGEIEEAGVFRRSKPPAGFAARCGQIQEDLLRVAAGILPDDRPKRGEASRRAIRGQRILLIRLIHSADIQQDFLARSVDSQVRLIQAAGRFRIGQRFLHAALSDINACMPNLRSCQNGNR